MHIDSIEITMTQLKKRAARAKVYQIWLLCGQHIEAYRFAQKFENFEGYCQRGCESLTRTRKFVDLTAFLNEVQNEIFDSTFLS